MMSGRKRGSAYFKVALSGVANCYRAHPPVFIALMAVSALLCAIEVGEIYAMQRLFDAAELYAKDAISLDDTVRAALPVVVVLLAAPLVSVIEYLGQGYFWRRGSGYLMARYHARIAHIPLVDFERQDTFDKMKRAQAGSEAAPSASRTVLQFAFHFAPYLALTSAYLFSLKPALAILLPIIFASVALAHIVRANAVRRFEEENAQLRRQTEYLEKCVTGREYARETRTLGAVPYFLKRFIDSASRLNGASIASEKKIARAEFLLRMVNVLGYAGILALMLHYVVVGEISVGAFAAVFYAVERMSGVLRGMIEQFGEALEELAAASFTHEFLSAPDELGVCTPIDKRTDIRLEGVSFAYPGGEDVIRNVHLTIARGETLAIVGENGAGKTTLVKLIMGLYRPTRGAVLLGGEDLNAHLSRARFDRVSSVFQHFVRYKFTARENIEISDPCATGDAEAAARRAGAQIMDAVLSREFGGTDLSGGEWQRIAIARGLYRAHDIIVLDEPTSAIDPIEETNIFELFKRTAEGKTAILVTHRLGSAKIADRILLMEDGKVCETGTHEELIEKGGTYARMYAQQRIWYER